MGNLHLVTGYAGREHVTSADQGAFHVAMFGGGQYVLDRGNKLSASIVTNSIVRVLDGEIYMQGRYIRLNEGTYVDLSIENGTQGYKRNDLIVARYTKDVRTGVEDCNLVVLKGDNSTGTPADPAHTEGDLLVDHAVTNDVPLYRVVLNGLVTESVTPLFSVLTDIPDRLDAIKTDIKTNYAPLSHKKRHATGGADALSPADIGAVPTTRTINSKALSANVTLKSDNINVPTATSNAFGLGSTATIDGVLSKLKKSALIDIKGLYQKYTTIGAIPAGTVITLNESGSPVEFYVAQHNYESELNGTGRTLLVRKDCTSNRSWHSTNVNAYATSSIDSWLNSTYKAMLDANIQSAMGTTKFKYTPKNGNNNVDTLERSVFFLSVTEIGKTTPYNTNAEGTALDAAAVLQSVNLNGSVSSQWTRSPRTDSTEGALYLTTSGIVDSASCSSALGCRPAFTLPASHLYTVYLDEDGKAYTEQVYTTDLTDVLGNKVNLGGTKVACGTYTGTGAYGTANPNSLEFGFAPTFVLLFNAAGRIGEEGTCMILLQGRTTAAAYNSKGSTVAWTDTGVSWYTDGTIPHYQMNVKNTPYVWLAVQ